MDLFIKNNFSLHKMHKMLIFGLESSGLLWIIIILTLSFTAEDSLVSKWCNAKFLQICSNEQTTYILDDLRVSKFSALIKIFGWSIPLIVVAI